MKELIFTDLHLANYQKWGYKDSEKMTRRLFEIKGVLQQIINICVEQEIKVIKFGGDFFHNDKEISTEVLNVAKWFFDEIDKLNIKFYAVRGNHDLSLQKSCDPQLHYSLNPFLKQELKLPKDTYFGHYDQKHDVASIKGYNLVIIHDTPVGAKLGSHTFEEGIDWKTLAKNNKFVLFGHIHKRQILSNNAIVMGCPMALDFGDTEDRGCYILDGYELEFVKLKYPYFFTIDAKDDEGKRSPDHYFRITGADHNSISENEVNVKKPTFFESRIKSTLLADILKEWLKLQNKPTSYFKGIESLIQHASDGLRTINDVVLQKVELEDFLSFKEATFDVQAGLNLVEGLGGDFSSNGSGKSSLLEAIFWCLFGETTKGMTGDDVIRKYPERQKDCRVTLHTFDINTDINYLISRSRKDGLKVYKEVKEGWDNLVEGMKLKESQEYLENFLGFEKSTFLASGYFSQDSLLLLTKIGVAEKNNMVTTLLGFDQYDRLQSDVMEIIKECNLNKVEYETNREKLQIQIDYELRDTTNLENRVTEIENKISDIKLLGTRLKHDIIAREAQLESLKKSGIQLDTSVLDQQEHNLKHLLEKAEEHLLKNFKEENLQPQIDRIYEEIGQLKQEKRYLESQADSKDVKLMKIEGAEEGETCESCGAVVTLEHMAKYISGLKFEIAELTDKAQKIDYSKLEKEYKELSDKKLLSEKTYKDHVKVINDLNNSLIKIGKDRQKVIESSNKVGTEELEIKGLKEKLEMYRVQLSEQRLYHMEAKNKIDECSMNLIKLNQKLEDKNLELKELEDNLVMLDFWRESFSYKGIKSLLLDGFCNSINDILNKVMVEVSNGVIQCEFSPTSITKSGESRNKLDLMVYMNGTLQGYESLSGGEKKRVDIGVALAFSKWLRKQYSLSSSLLGVVIFDELFDSLDSHARECILPLLKGEGQDQAVFLISHTSDLGAYADRVIQVKKINKVSVIV